MRAGKLAATEAEVQEARAEASEAQKAASKAEGDIEGLGDAYNALEAANYQLEAQLTDLRSQAQPSGAQVWLDLPNHMNFEGSLPLWLRFAWENVVELHKPPTKYVC